MGGKLSVVGPNPLAKPLAVPPERQEVAAEPRPRPATRYVTKTLGWRAEDQEVLDGLREQLAAIGKGVWTERDVVAAALRYALQNPWMLDR